MTSYERIHTYMHVTICNEETMCEVSYHLQTTQQRGQQNHPDKHKNNSTILMFKNGFSTLVIFVNIPDGKRWNIDPLLHPTGKKHIYFIARTVHAVPDIFH